MWGAIIGSAVSLGSGIYGQIKASKASEETNNLLDKKERGIDSFYGKEINKNVLDTDYAKATLKKFREQMEERRKRSDSTAAITGASDESKIAVKADEAKGVSSAITSLAQYGSQRRDALRSEYMGKKDGIIAARVGMAQGKQQSANNLTNNAWNSIGSFIKTYEKGEKKDSDNDEDDKEISEENKSGNEVYHNQDNLV